MTILVIGIVLVQNTRRDNLLLVNIRKLVLLAFVVNGWDIVASGETFNRNTSVDGWTQTNATIGFQYWFYKKCRFQVQYTRCFCGDQIGKDYNWLQSQIQVAF